MPPKRKHNKAIPEEDVLSDDEPKTITLTKEQKLTSKNIIIECPICSGKIQLRNEIEINPKTGITCRCSPCSFKLSKNDKTMNVSRDDQGEIKLDCEDHSISFSFNRLTTPESDEEKKKYEMISDVMNTAQMCPVGSSDPNTPRNKPSSSMEDLDLKVL